MISEFNCRFNTRNVRGGAVKLETLRAVSRKSLVIVSDKRIEELKKVNLKKRTKAKMNWGVAAYNEWHQERLRTFNYNVAIYESDLNDLPNLTKLNFCHAMCHFIPEVSRQKGEGLYPGHTLYQLVTSIQKYLHVNKVYWKLIESPEFEDLHNVLDNVMKERTEAQIGTVKHQAKFITYEFENDLWEKGFLGEDSPDRLRVSR